MYTHLSIDHDNDVGVGENQTSNYQEQRTIPSKITKNF